MTRRAYPKYKPSGVEWLGDIPEHWGIKRLKFLATEPLKYGANQSAELEDPALPRFIRITDISEGGSLREDTFKSLPEEIAEPFLLNYGDLLFARSGATIGKTFMYRESWGRSCYAGYLIRFRTKSTEILPEFISYFTVSSSYWGWLSSVFIQATIQNVSAEKYANLFISTPPSEEQGSIISFLDRETGRIDALMEKKQRQIELLQEKRSALISHAVTKGLNPNIEMKDSGVEWLGQVPAHWELRRLKFVAKIQTGLTLGKDYKDVPTISRPYLRVANVQDGYLDLNDITEIIIPEGDTKRHELKQGDVLMTEGGDFDKLGRGYVWEGQIDGCLHQNHIFAVRPNHKYLASLYLSTLMTSSYGKAYFTSTSQQTTNLATTNITKLKHFLLPLPNIREQCSILDWLGRNISKMDGLIAKIQESIDRLKEYRTALISAAVTGQIDVREAGT